MAFRISSNRLSGCGSSFATEFQHLQFGDRRLNRRFVQLMDRFLDQPHAPINQACLHWSETKAAYRLFDNERVQTEEILRAHFEQTLLRMKSHPRVIAIEDTTHINYHAHPATQGLGSIGKNPAQGKKNSQGLIAHTTLAVTPQGTPLGVLDQKTWARAQGEPTTSREARFDLSLKESHKWFIGCEKAAQASQKSGSEVILVCDREADITELMAYAKRCHLQYVIRAKSTRSVAVGTRGEELEHFLLKQKPVGVIRIRILEREKILGVSWRKHRYSGETREVELEVRVAPVSLRLGQNKFNIAPSDEELKAYGVLLTEKNPPARQKEVRWILVSSLPAENLQQAQQIIELYRLRWGIENFHKILKSGCRVEECRLGTAERLQRFIAAMSIVAFRLYLLTRWAREEPDSSCRLALSETEWKALYMKVHRTHRLPKKPPTLYEATRWIARLGGYLDRNNDPPPGSLVLWRGWQRLTELTDMFELLTEAS